MIYTNPVRVEKKKFLLKSPQNNYILKTHIVFTNNFLNIFSKHTMFTLINLLTQVLHLNKNILFLDNNVNYNYLPISNESLFNRPFKKLWKQLKYFDVSLIFYFNLNKKKFIFKKLRILDVIHVSSSNELFRSKFDFSFELPNNNQFYNYIIYLIVLKTYINVKIKN
jgi:hypothetical protein